MNFQETGNFVRQGVTGNFMNQLAKTGILLGRPANNGKWPDGIFPGIDLSNLHYGKRMCKAIIAKMIAKRSFRFILSGIDFAGNYKISIGTNTEIVKVDITKASSPQRSCKGHFTDTFRQ